MNLYKMILGIDKQDAKKAKNAEHISISDDGGMSIRASSYFVDAERREAILQMSEERRQRVDELLKANAALNEQYKKRVGKLAKAAKDANKEFVS